MAGAPRPRWIRRLLATALVFAGSMRMPAAGAQIVPQWPNPAVRVSPATPSPTSIPPSVVAGRRTRALEGALVGFALGATATIIVTHSGGSTSLCDRGANQDAISASECLGLAAAGGLAGAGVGVLIGRRIRISGLQALPPPEGQGRGSRLILAAVNIGGPPRRRPERPATVPDAGFEGHQR